MRLLVFAIVPWIACVSAPVGAWCSLWGRPDPIDANCLRKDAAGKYLEELQKHAARALRLPPGYNDDGYVEVRFVLAPDGSVSDRCIARSSHTELAETVLAALDSASFPPVPRYARCVAGAEIERKLRTVKH